MQLKSAAGVAGGLFVSEFFCDFGADVIEERDGIDDHEGGIGLAESFVGHQVEKVSVPADQK